MDIKRIKEQLLKLDQKKKIKFIYLFGSQAKQSAHPLSDTDIAVYYEGTPKEKFLFRAKALGELPPKVDLHIFQDMPLAVQHEVISGEVIYYSKYQFLIEQVLKVIQEFSSFEKYYDKNPAQTSHPCLKAGVSREVCFDSGIFSMPKMSP